MTNYVAGFLFNNDKTEVLLIRKKKPEWQKGKLNGIGGKVEEIDVLAENAMSREFEEEAGVKIPPKSWNLFCQYFWDDGIVNFYYIIDHDNKYFTKAKTCTSETILRVEIDALNRSQPVFSEKTETIYNLRWLIPLALDPSLQNHFKGPLGNWITVSE